jgi:site-specific DNA-methyltransferase (adenine-specific)
MKQYKLMLGDNMVSLKKLPDNSIDSVVTDPPYALTPSKGAKAGFMGKLWDAEVPSVEFWQEVYRVLKPGGHILSFGGTRTYHRMVVNIEDAGFEIRDQIMWIYGSGFPKSHNIGKAVDKIEGNKREVVRTKTGGAYSSNTNNVGIKQVVIDCNDGRKTAPTRGEDFGLETKGNSAYEGYGTALKPANEPICVARKPISEKTVAANMMKWGTGGINVDGCRIGNEVHKVIGTNISGKIGENQFDRKGEDRNYEGMNKEVEGRFPANIIFDEEAAELLDQQSGFTKTKADKNYKHNKTECDGNTFTNRGTYTPREDKGGASRFFYVAKVSKKERNLGLDEFEDKEKNKILPNRKCTLCKKWENKGAGGGIDWCKCDESILEDLTIKTTKNFHPTVKPINLMTYLIRLVTPENGIILEPFMGSGSTGIAAMLEGRRFVGMEMDEEYFKIAEKRIESWEQYKKLIKL